MSDRTITISLIGDRYSVTMAPPIGAGDHDRSFNDHESANVYATALQDKHGGPVVDRTGWVPGAGIFGRARS